MKKQTFEPDGDVAIPCVRNCCLDQNDMCLGCYRLLSEILAWHQASTQEKKDILSRCQYRRSQHPQHKIYPL